MGVTQPTGDPESTVAGPAADWYAGHEDALYRWEEERLVPGPLCGGPWDPEHQHGGAVSGILAHLVESVPTATPMRFCRHTVELMRAVPMRKLAPDVWAIFLDPLTETSMRPALLLGDASFAIFSNRPMATPIAIITLLPLAMPSFNLFRQQLWSSAGT